MSSNVKKSKLDLLVRVRYSNPLPPPPCPPKLLDIPTNPMRYARPEFLNTIANNTPLPMIVDAECGMPLDLGKWLSLWEEGGDDIELNPDPDNLPPLDPEDVYLLNDPSTTGGQYLNGHSAGIAAPPAHVTWLRKTEYISSSKEGVPRKDTQEPKHTPAAIIDVSHGAQIRDIEASFAACNDNFSLESLRHPNKPNVTAVESYEILPDADIWANAYDLFRFSERPGERAVDVEDPRLDCAILRPMESDGDHFLAYYLTKDDQAALEFKNARFEQAPYAASEGQGSTAFHFVRDYETVKVEQEVLNEFLLVMDDGLSVDDDVKIGSSRARADRSKGAYYKNIERKMVLKKKRVNIHEEYQDKWQVINLTYVAMSKEEEEERQEVLAEVLDPMFLMNRADAEGEPDVEVGGGMVVDGEIDVGT